MWSKIKFQGLILRKTHIFITFFEFLRQSPRIATYGILNFTDQAITFETNANLAIKFLLKIETYKDLQGGVGVGWGFGITGAQYHILQTRKGKTLFGLYITHLSRDQHKSLLLID